MLWSYQFDSTDGSVKLFLDGNVFSTLGGSTGSHQHRMLRAARFVLDMTNGILNDESMPASSVRSIIKATASVLETISDAD